MLPTTTAPGLSFLLKQLFLGSHPKQPSEIVSFTEGLKEHADTLLKNSKRLEGLDLEKKGDVNLAIEKLKENEASQDWHTMTMGAFCESVSDALNEKDALKAAWAGYMLGTVRGLTIVTDRLFEQTPWKGYLANQVVYEAAAAASQTAGESEAIKKLEPLFRNLDEATLHTWVERATYCTSDRRESTSRRNPKRTREVAFASFERGRVQAVRAASERRADWELRIKWLTLGVAAMGALFTVLKLFGLL